MTPSDPSHSIPLDIAGKEIEGGDVVAFPSKTRGKSYLRKGTVVSVAEKSVSILEVHAGNPISIPPYDLAVIEKAEKPFTHSGYDAIVVRDRDGYALHLTKLPGTPKRLLLGITGQGDEPYGLVVPASYTPKIQTALSLDRPPLKINASDGTEGRDTCVLRITQSNRAEPFARGVEISLENLRTYDGARVFLEGHILEEVLSFLTDR